MEKKLDWDYIETRLLEDGIPETHIGKLIEKLKRIDQLRHEKNAIILAHYYQTLPIQLIADVCGDSLSLAMSSDAIKGKDLVISSTVHFMAEMIKLLNPEKKVLIPNSTASCSIAEGMNGATLAKIKEHYPESTLVGYINSTAEVKAHLDYCCTSSNAVEVVEKVEGNPVIMVPDEYFGKNIYKLMDTKKDYYVYHGIRNDSIILIDMSDEHEIAIPLNGTKKPQLDKGICIVHEEFTEDHVDYYKKTRGVELVLAHPEVKPEVAKKADMVGGTGKMIQFIGTTKANKILYLTECDLAAPLIGEYPERDFITPCVLCPYMKKNSVDLLLRTLENEEEEVTVDESIMRPARASITKMFEITGKAQKVVG